VTYIVVGAASGLIMMLIFVAVTPLMVFSLARDESHWTNSFIQRVQPTTLMLGIVALAFPAWTTFGVVLALLYRASEIGVPGGTIGSFNMVYSGVLSITAIAFAVPVGILLRKVVNGVAVLTLSFVGVFGWLLPLMAHYAQR
jgi:hypothetical protein